MAATSIFPKISLSIHQPNDIEKGELKEYRLAKPGIDTNKIVQ